MTVSERRRAPRVDLVGQLHGQLVAKDVAIDVREISLGGMSFQTAKPFDLGTHHEFLLTLGDGAGVVVLGRIAYCNKSIDREAAAMFIVGIQFLDEDSNSADGEVDNLDNLDTLIRRVH